MQRMYVCTYVRTYARTLPLYSDQICSTLVSKPLFSMFLLQSYGVLAVAKATVGGVLFKFKYVSLWFLRFISE